MQIGARMAAGAEVLEEIIVRHLPAAMALSDWGRKHRFAGSGDRSAIGNLVYDALRRRHTWYMHGVLFMAGAAYALFLDEHVRVDIFYSNMSVKKRAWIDLLGSIFFLIPLCLTTWWFAWGYVANSWAVMETSTEGSGLPYIYLFKTVILLFAGLVLLQAISVVIRSARKLFGHSLMVESAETGGY